VRGVYSPSIIRIPMSSPLRLNVLGAIEVLDATGTPLPLTGRKLQGLLAFLAIEHHREHRREELATLLWGEMMQERSRHNLRQALSKLKRVHPGLLVVRDDVVALDMAACVVDVGEFLRLATSRDPRDLERARELYRGDLLAGVVTLEPEFDDWLRGARIRLRDSASAVYERLAETMAQAGRVEDALACLQQRLRLDTACEAAHRGIMRLLADRGRRSDALRQFEQCVDVLEREFGIEPDEETLALRDAIVAAGAQNSGQRYVVPVESELRSLEPPSVAVLPFENLSGSEESYLVNGLCEDLTTALSRFSTLFVISNSATHRFSNHDGSLADIASVLGVHYLVRGNVQRAGKTLRLNVQLIDARSGQHRFAQRFDADYPDVLIVQDEITATIVSTLAGRVEADGMARARRMPAERLDAYDLVLRGKDHHHRHTPEDCKLAIEMFQRAIECDGEYAVPHAWLACCYGQEMSYRPDETWSLMERAHEAAERGRDLDDDESECHRILAQVFILRQDLARSQSHQERALLLNANDDRSVCAMGEILNLRGRPEEAERWVRKAMRLNPYHSDSYRFHLGRSLFHAGRRADARDALGRITRPRPRDLAYVLASTDGPQRASVRERLLELDPGFEVEAFVAAMPYEHATERDRLGAALVAADDKTSK
jgi:DNA-binding SARP family transcriptional activator